MSAIPNAPPSGFGVHGRNISHSLGLGGFAITYVAFKKYLSGSRATHGPDHQVLPLTPQHSTDYACGLGDFISEERSLARFNDPVVVRVLSAFERHGTAYLVMRFERRGTMGVIEDEYSA